MEFAPESRTCAIQPLLDALFEHVLYDEQPLFISDEATIWDVSVSLSEEILARCSTYYATSVRLEELRAPLWKLLPDLEARRQRSKHLSAIIKGDKPLKDLEAIGVRFQIDAIRGEKFERRLTVAAKDSAVVAPKLADVAAGLLHYKADPKALHEWACFLSAATDLFDFSSFDQFPEGEALLNALWDASFANELNAETLLLANALVER